MLRIAWQNRSDLRWAWKVLTRGVCDGCALGTTGLKDWTIDGTHLCMVRLELLRLNTQRAFDPSITADVAALAKLSSKELREKGRIPFPLRRRAGERGFTRVAWKDVWDDVGARWRKFAPERTAMFVTSRGITNETYYTAQKVMRFLGSANVDNSARICHSPSTAGLKTTIGVAATTCSYKDWFSSDVIVFLGSNPANDQPVAMKYLVEAKRLGARILCVNAYREPGMERYWVPSTFDSALFGTNITDRFFMVKVGGDLAFLNAVQKNLIARGVVATDFIGSATVGFDDLRRELESQSYDDLLRIAGTTAEEIDAFAAEIAAADRGCLVWSMGITQHEQGGETVRAIANLGLLKEWVGREGCGLMPIRGHSGVQGGAEMGAYATAFPGGLSVDAEAAAHFSKLWGFAVPSTPGLTAVDALESAIDGGIDGYWCIGGNFLETMPEPDRIRTALEKMALRVHTDIVLSSQMLVDPKDTVYILPSKTRYEQKDGGTETSTERRVIFSPELSGHEIGESKSEWEMLVEFAKAVRGVEAEKLLLSSGRAIREDIARAVPVYGEIKTLAKAGDAFQWGGPHLCAGRNFPTDDKKAHFQPVRPTAIGRPNPEATDGKFKLATRRGKQFNSMIQAETDPMTGAARDHVFMHPDDARRLGLRRDDIVLLRSRVGTFRGRVFPAPVAPGTLQGHWPEVNVLVPSGIVDQDGGVPDYNAWVSVEAATVD